MLLNVNINIPIHRHKILLKFPWWFTFTLFNNVLNWSINILSCQSFKTFCLHKNDKNTVGWDVTWVLNNFVYVICWWHYFGEVYADEFSQTFNDKNIIFLVLESSVWNLIYVCEINWDKAQEKRMCRPSWLKNVYKWQIVSMCKATKDSFFLFFLLCICVIKVIMGFKQISDQRYMCWVV